MRVRAFLVAVVGAALVATAATGAASAGGPSPYLPAERVLTVGSVPALTANADGSVWGAGHVAGRLVLLHRSPRGAWSRRALPYTGWPLAVADDGATTFLVFTTWSPDGRSTDLRIARVPHGGAPVPSRLLDTASSIGPARVIVRDGRWWAAWNSETRMPPEPFFPEGYWLARLRQARTVAPAFARREIASGPPGPSTPELVSLAWRGDRALLATTHESPGSVFLSTADAGGTFRGASDAVLVDVGWPAVTVSGGRTFIAFVQDPGRRHALVLAQDHGDLDFRTRRTVPTRAPVESVGVAASGGRVYVAHDECFRAASTGRDTCRGYVAEAGMSGLFRTTDVTAPLAVGNPGVRATVSALTAARGRATVTVQERRSLAPVYATTRR
jgi:hypothetical protein